MSDQMKTQFLSEEDFATLFAFETHVSDADADGYTQTKADMKRLAEIGVVHSFGFGRYGITAFGHWLIETEFEQAPTLPLRTAADNNAREVAGLKLYLKERATDSPAWVNLPDADRLRWKDRAAMQDAPIGGENGNG